MSLHSDAGGELDVVVRCALERFDDLPATLEKSPEFRQPLDLAQFPGGRLYARTLGQRTALRSM